MNNLKPAVWVAFVLTLAAGAVGGAVAVRFGLAPAPAEGGASLMSQLQLRPDQNEKMRLIWEGVRENSQSCLRRGEALQRERDNALFSLLNPEQKSQFRNLDDQYLARFDDLKAERESTFRKAVEQTNAILDETQRKRYARILKERTGRDPEPMSPVGDLGPPAAVSFLAARP